MTAERPFAMRRRELGLPLEAAAALLRVSPRHLRALELGRRPLTLPLADRMAGVYASSIHRLTRPPE